MTIKIQAAARLQVLAKADEAQARKYLESLGLSPLKGKSPMNETGKIWLYLDEETEDAVKAVTSHLGVPKISKKGRITFYKFRVSNSRHVVVCGGPGVTWVLLTDSEDLPTADEMEQLSKKSGPKMSRRLK